MAMERKDCSDTVETIPVSPSGRVFYAKWVSFGCSSGCSTPSLILQTAKRNHIHAIVAAVSNLTNADENHEKGGLLHLGGINLVA